MKFLLTRLLRDGRTTTSYPRQPITPPPGVRGKPTVDVSKCDGCGDCARVCPTPALQVLPRADAQIWRLDVGSCIFCGLCADACPTDAIHMSPAFELAATSRAALVEEIRIPARGMKGGAARG